MKFDLKSVDDRIKAANYFNKLLDQDARIEMKAFRDSKTNRQNKYLHACFKVLSEFSGYTLEEIKQIMKMRCDFMKVEKGDHLFLRSISELDTLEMTRFIDSIRMFGLENNVYLMTPEEYYLDSFNIDKKLGL